jgi:pSer/pThr/pTyr-binding forkhead associated (FHA) protein
MADDRTRILERPGGGDGQNGFFARFRASIVVVEGGAEGTEYTLQADRVTLGRGPGVDLAFDDSCMSRQHVALELTQDGFRLRDLGSTNGVVLNEAPVEVASLKHGDRFKLGEHTFQYVVEERARAPRVYAIPDVEE